VTKKRAKEDGNPPVAALAALLLVAHQVMKSCDLTELTPEGIVEALGASRSQAYEWAARLREWLATRPGPGRPKKAAGQVDASADVVRVALDLCKRTRNWLLQNPGGASAGPKRTTYTDDFRAFVVDQLTADGPVAELSCAAAADAVGVLPGTLTRWLSPSLPVVEDSPQESAASAPLAASAAASAAPVPSADSTSAVATPAPSEATDSTTACPAERPKAEEPAAEPERTTLLAPEPQAVASLSTSAENMPLTISSTATVITKQAQEPELPTVGHGGQAAKILELFKHWKGTLEAFCRSLKHHGVACSAGVVRSLLAASGQRLPRHRRQRNPDAEFSRGDYQRPDPNTQWATDGTTIEVRVGDRIHRRTAQAIIDNGSDAIVGVAIRRHEDAQGVLEAYASAKETTGVTPIAVLRDGRKCNTAEEIEDALARDRVIGQFGTPRRPQSNTIAETTYSHLKQHVGPAVLPDPPSCTEDDLVDSVALNLMQYYGAGRNVTFRRRLGQRTPLQAQAEHGTTPEREADQRKQMERIKSRLEANLDSPAARNREAAGFLVQESFRELGVADTNGRKVATIAKYGLEAVTEAIGVLNARNQAGTGPDAHPERFLLNTTRHIAYRNQDMRIFETILDKHAKAGRIILKPLEDELTRLRRDLAPEAFLKEILHRTLYSPTLADRVFWRRAFMADFERLPPHERIPRGRWAAARIAGRLKVHYKERQYFLSLIALAAVPLVA